MRTGPFSSPIVIELLNSRFVPAYAVNEDYRDGGRAHPDEKREYLRIYREALDAGLSAGTVHVYVVDPEDGHPVDSMHVAEAAKTEKLAAMLRRLADARGVRPGPPVVPPQPQSRPPSHEPGDLVLHLVARPISPQGSWDGIAENWVVYTRDEARALLPPEPSRADLTWQVDPDLAARLLVHVYPVTENNDPEKNEILESRLTGRVIGRIGNAWLARLDGRLTMRHDFYYETDGKVVESGLLGYISFDPESQAIRALRLTTEDARYNGGRFGVAVRERQ